METALSKSEFCHNYFLMIYSITDFFFSSCTGDIHYKYGVFLIDTHLVSFFGKTPYVQKGMLLFICHILDFLVLSIKLATPVMMLLDRKMHKRICNAIIFFTEVSNVGRATLTCVCQFKA